VQNSTVVFQLNFSNNINFCASKSRPNAKPQSVMPNSMKLYISAIFLFGLIACTSQSNENNVSDSETNSLNSDFEFMFEGVWGLTNYFDTILTHQELSKYRMQRPTWFGILLDIRDDRIFNYGSIYNDSAFYKLNNDTLRIFEMYEENWCLIKRNPELLLCQLPNAKKIDSTIYIYRKRDDLKYMTQNLNERRPLEKIGPHIRNYFEKEFFQGTYTIKNTEKIVKFGTENQIEGFNNYTTYKLDEYFGTYHPFNNEDVLFLEVDTSNYYDCWNWKINNNELVLTKFKQDWKDRDNFILTKEQIVLVKN
jgi:hypothetical protein